MLKNLIPQKNILSYRNFNKLKFRQPFQQSSINRRRERAGPDRQNSDTTQPFFQKGCPKEDSARALRRVPTIWYLINRYSDHLSRMEIEILLSHIFECTRTELYINNITIDENAERLCDLLVQRRLSGEPLQYITGHSEFMELDFTVNKDVFIPRPETELLVREVSLLALSRQLSTNRSLRILDLCTGCGNIAISLARLMPAAEIVATDISGPSLEIAEENSIIHGVNKNIAFYKGDLFQALPRSKSAPEVRHPALSVEGQDYFERGLPFDKKYKFDIIVCNPPYIKSLELGFLQKEVRFEPRISLDGGLDGLEFYRRIAKTAPAYLKTKGSLFLEIGFGQSKYVKDIFSSGGLFAICKVQKDFANIERVIWISLF